MVSNIPANLYELALRRILGAADFADLCGTGNLTQALESLQTIYAVYHVEAERAATANRNRLQRQLHVIRNNMKRVISIFDDTRPLTRSVKAITEAFEDDKTQMHNQLQAFFNLRCLEKEDYEQSFSDFTTEIITALKKAEELFLYADHVQAEFDAMSDVQKSASYFSQPTDDRRMQNFRLAYRAAYPYLRSYSKDKPFHLVLPLIESLYEFVFDKKYGIAVGSKWPSARPKQRDFIPRWNSPGLRFSYRVIRELGILQSLPNIGKYGPYHGPRGCDSEDCLSCRYAEAKCMTILGDRRNNKKQAKNRATVRSGKPKRGSAVRARQVR
jgi:hypothetical protein